MAKPKDKNPQPQPQTTDKGLEIPIPTRDAFLRDLEKAAPPARPGDDKPGAK